MLLLLSGFLQWELSDRLGWLSVGFFYIPVFLVFIGGLVWSLVHFFRRFKKEHFRPALPASVNLVALALILFVPFGRVAADMDFRANLKARQEVVSMVLAGQLTPSAQYDSCSVIPLPAQYRSLSKGGGDILVDKNNGQTKVFFYIYRGMLDDCSGFAFIQSQDGLSDGDFSQGLHQIRKMQDHWYWGAS